MAAFSNTSVVILYKEFAGSHSGGGHVRWKQSHGSYNKTRD